MHLDTDLARYMEYIDASAFGDGSDLTIRQVKARIAKFKEGQGIIKLPSGKQGVVQFYNRESEHPSHAPKTQAAVNAYRDVKIDKGKQYGAFAPEGDGQEAVQEMPVPAQEQTIADAVRVLLQAEPGLSGRAIATRLGCSPTTALKWKEIVAEQGQATAMNHVEVKQNASMPVPILPDKGPRAEEIDLAAAITLWNSGYNSHRKLMKVFGITKCQAGRLSQMIREQAKVCRK